MLEIIILGEFTVCDGGVDPSYLNFFIIECRVCKGNIMISLKISQLVCKAVINTKIVRRDAKQPN